MTHIPISCLSFFVVVVVVVVIVVVFIYVFFILPLLIFHPPDHLALNTSYLSVNLRFFFFLRNIQNFHSLITGDWVSRLSAKTKGQNQKKIRKKKERAPVCAIYFFAALDRLMREHSNGESSLCTSWSSLCFSCSACMIVAPESLDRLDPFHA